LKKRFITKPILVALDLDRKMKMEMDASNYIIEGVLLMEYRDGK